MIGFAIAILVLGFIMGYVNKKDDNDEEELTDEMITDDTPMYENEIEPNVESKENEEKNENNEKEDGEEKEFEEEVVEKVKEIEEQNVDTSLIDYDENYETVFSSNDKFDEKTISQAVEAMHKVITLQFSKSDVDINEWEALVNDKLFEKIRSGEMDDVIYTNSDVIEVQSVPIESKSDNLILGGVATTLNNEMYLHEYDFVESEGKVLLNNIKLIWKH